jgi:multimeric flavodoxin WrbA
MADAVVEGVNDPEITGVELRVRRALDAGVDDVRWCEAIILGTPANLGYMSGALKHFFDTIYYPCLDHTRGLPYALFVKGSTDTDGAVLAIHKIATGLAWKEVQPPVTTTHDVTEDVRAQCVELGQTMAAGLEMGVF